MKVLQRGDGILQEVEGVIVRHSGTSEGTGSDQEISHGFTNMPQRLDLVPLDIGVPTVFSNRIVDTTHFHITVSAGRNFAWVAEDW